MRFGISRQQSRGLLEMSNRLRKISPPTRRIATLFLAGAFFCISAVVAVSFSRPQQFEFTTNDRKHWHCITVFDGRLTWAVAEDSNPSQWKEKGHAEYIHVMREIWLGTLQWQRLPHTRFSWRNHATYGTSTSCRFSLVALPIWPLSPILFATIAGGVCLRFLWNRRSSHPVCPSCEYDLYGNESGICPECGTPVTGQLRKKINSMV